MKVSEIVKNAIKINKSKKYIKGKQKLKTIEMEIALMRHLNIRQNLIVPNVYWGINGLNYECDLVKLTQNNYATEIEIKVSKNDLLKDKEKFHGHVSNLFKYLYFAVPLKLKDIALKVIPGRAGLFVIKKTDKRFVIDEVKKPIMNKNSIQWNKERYKLAELGAMRILKLKEKILEQNRKQL